MALPSVLKNFNIFNDANSMQGIADEIVLPKLTVKVEEWRGGGMNGPIDIDLGTEKMELEHTLKGFSKLPYTQFGNVPSSQTLLRFNGAYQEDITCAVQAVQIVVRGRHTEIDGGNAKASEAGSTKVKSTLTYYKLTIDNEDIIEIDLLNFVYIVNGKDQLEAQRTAIGL